MNLPLALGYQPIYEPWQILYMIIIGWSAMVAFGGLLFDLYGNYRYRHNLHWSGALVALAAFFSMHPFSLVTVFWLNVLVFDTAPIGAALIAATFTLFGIWAFLYLAFFQKSRYR